MSAAPGTARGGDLASPRADATLMVEGGAGEVALARLQVFVGDWGGEPIPFDDAIPFSLT